MRELDHSILSMSALDLMEVLIEEERRSGQWPTVSDIEDVLGKQDGEGMAYRDLVSGLVLNGYASLVDLGGVQRCQLERPLESTQALRDYGRLAASGARLPRERLSALAERSTL